MYRSFRAGPLAISSETFLTPRLLSTIGTCTVEHMSSSQVSSSTAVRRSRVGNVGTDRLLRRQDHLLVLLVVNGARSLPTRNRMVVRAQELDAVERELRDRGVQSVAEQEDGREAARLMADRVEG